MPCFTDFLSWRLSGQWSVARYADFSGTYTGRVSYEAHGTTEEEAILTITGNR